MKNGIDCIREHKSILGGKRLGLLTSVSGVDKLLSSTVDILNSEYTLTALYGPEHGVRGAARAGEMVDSSIDAESGLPVYSLYRKDSKRFSKEMLENVDAVVYDIQDIGSRYYTYISSLKYALEDCAAHNKELIVLDRLNPLGGDIVEGNILTPDYSSFVGCYDICNRYALTSGEFAKMVNEEQGIGCSLTVIPVQGWRRSQMFCDTDMLWLMPSLGIPRFETALLYPGMCFFEGTNLSEGRGTSCPFEIIGAPWINGAALCKKMNSLKLNGVIFTAAYFAPSFSKHTGEQCQGVHAHISDIKSFKPLEAALTLLYTIREMYPQSFAFLPPVKQGGRAFMDLLFGEAFAGEQLPALDKLVEGFTAQSNLFAKRKQKYHLYE